MTRTEAAETIALQVVVAARRSFQHQLDQGVIAPQIDGRTLIEEILSEAAGGHMGGYLKQAAETTCLRTVRTHVKRLIKG